MKEDPTKIQLQTNVMKSIDPTIIRMTGVATHGMTPFDVPFMTQIEGNLWQGGIDSRLNLQLPHFIKHVVSVYPWEEYKIKHGLKSFMSVEMFDSLDQSMEEVDAIARWVNVAKQSGPILVHCQAGLNRSSLIVARALMLEGKSATEAIALIRSQRSPACLCNPAFEEHLMNI